MKGGSLILMRKQEVDSLGGSLILNFRAFASLLSFSSALCTQFAIYSDLSHILHKSGLKKGILSMKAPFVPFSC